MRSTVIDYLQQNKINVIDEKIDEKLTEWEQWYKSDVKGFHDYQQYNGKKSVSKKRKSLFMPAKVAQDWADLLLNERVDITVAGRNKTASKKAQDTLDRLLKQTNFYVRGNNLIEIAFAIGGGYFVEYYDPDKQQTRINYIPQDMAFPISMDSGKITEAAFASKIFIDGTEYIYIEIHTLDKDKNYVIDNVFISQNGTDKKYTEAGQDFYKTHKIKDKWKTGSPYPLFQQIRPNIVNRYNYDSAYGVSVYDTAIDAFKKCDSDFTAYYVEVALGKKRIFVKDGVTTVNYNDNGEAVRAFGDDDIFYSIPGDFDETQPIIESNMTLRVNEIETALQNSLNLISLECGFGSEGYKWEKGSVATARQIMSENSKMFRTLKKHEEVIRTAVEDMARGLLFVESTLGGVDVDPDVTVTVDFDDSIIEDTAEKKRQAMQDVTLEFISKAEYFRQIYGMDDKQAEEFVDKMAQEIMREQGLLQIESEPNVE